MDFDYRRILIAALLLGVQYAVVSGDWPTLAVEVIIAFFLSGIAWRYVKKSFMRPVLLFDLHGVLIAGDLQFQDLYENPGTRNLIRRLRKNYFVAALTNMSPEMWGLWNRKHHLAREFDAFYYSGKYGIRKPEPAIFQIVMRDLGVQARDIIFIDDVEVNIVVAKKLGIPGVVFDNAAQCERDLRAMGIRTR